MKVINDDVSDKSLIRRLVVTDVDEDVVEDTCFDILVKLHPNSTITCLDIDSDGCDVYDGCDIYHLTFLVEH